MRQFFVQNKTKLRCIELTIRRSSFLKHGRLPLSHHGTQHGLWGLPDLVAATDFRDLATASMAKCTLLRDEITKLGDTNPKKTLLLLDRISNEVCSVIDVAEFCRNVHEIPLFREEAEESFATLSTFIHGLNGDERLYQTLRHIVETDIVFQGLDREYQLFAIVLKAVFEVDGIHLSQQLRDQANALQGQVVTMETKFTQNTSRDDPNSSFVIGPFSSPQEHRRFSSWMESYVPQPYSLPSLHVLCSSQRRITGALLKSLDDESMRKLVWTKSMLEPSSNIIALGNLMKSRQELAKLLGYDSFAHKFLANKASKTPEEVWSFLEKVSESGRTQAQIELTTLADLKGTLTKGSGRAVLYPWDISYLTTVALTEEAQAFTYSDKKNVQSVLKGHQALAAVSSYLSLHACMEGLAGITLALFGIQTRFTDVPISESWRTHVSTDRDRTPLPPMGINENKALNHESSQSESLSLSVPFGGRKLAQFNTQTAISGVIKCEVSGPLGEPVGTVYLDLYQRSNKFPGAAHFTLRCGCSNIDGFSTIDDLSAVEGMKNLDGFSGLHGKADNDRIHENNDPKQYQLPIVALSFSFSPQIQKGTTQNGQHKTMTDPLLSLHDVETLHHEWGHALHSLLSRTTFQHLSGTRGALDFVEIPSHLFEHFARSPQVVSQWARHHITGQKLPDGLLEEAIQAKHAFSAVEQQNQLLYSLADQYMFGSAIGDLSTHTPEAAFVHAVQGVNQLQERYTDLPLGRVQDVHINGQAIARLPNMSFPSHSHFVNYGGGYYAYIFAKMHAAKIWDAHFAQDPLSRKGGDVIWHRMLRHGAGRDSKEMLQDLEKP